MTPCDVTRPQLPISLHLCIGRLKVLIGYMMTSSNETFSALLALCEGNPLVLTGGFPSQRSVTRNFDVFFDLRLNKWLSKQSRRRWFETSLCPLTLIWRILISCHEWGYFENDIPLNSRLYNALQSIKLVTKERWNSRVDMMPTLSSPGHVQLSPVTALMIWYYDNSRFHWS